MKFFKRISVPVLLLVLFGVIFEAGWSRRFSEVVENAKESVKIGRDLGQNKPAPAKMRLQEEKEERQIKH